MTAAATASLKRKECKSLHPRERKAAQCCAENHRCRAVLVTKPNRVAAEIASPCRCVPESRAADEILLPRGAPEGRPEDSRSGGGYRRLARATSSRLQYSLAAPSSAEWPVSRRSGAADENLEY